MSHIVSRGLRLSDFSRLSKARFSDRLYVFFGGSRLSFIREVGFFGPLIITSVLWFG
ncbi:hypothetical protein SAMN04488518_105132 [Pseudovibrio ascidiaceicola]|uniref:Uncharacterized protein n=1 Tax=Pseudovibrio ascidiaceicola TaxID=285279 RepID=A0A1I3ZKE8_9HYPH|nr:hypothetical protein SAMN04488518_105132 [Pseudovibrio ascidiaceicola]